MPPRTLIIGCGYIGLPLALAWRERGHEIVAWVHSRSTAEALAPHHFARVIIGSVADAALWQNLEPCGQVIHCASSSGGGVEAYREVFLEGARMMSLHQPRARRVLASSTSVYGQSQGEIVDEESPAEPASETSQILREAERVALAGGTIVVRSTGIYGPKRGALLEKLRRGEAVIEGDGLRWINQIHQRDLVSALVHLLEKGSPGQIYNASDDTPVTYRDFYAWCSTFWQLPLPPSGPVNLHRKRGLTNKRVSNAKLRATGWQPRYPSFREVLQDPTAL
jgi:nucleoside-diphosphate-sugar epimerase